MTIKSACRTFINTAIGRVSSEELGMTVPELIASRGKACPVIMGYDLASGSDATAHALFFSPWGAERAEIIDRNMTAAAMTEAKATPAPGTFDSANWTGKGPVKSGPYAVFYIDGASVTLPVLATGAYDRYRMTVEERRTVDGARLIVDRDGKTAKDGRTRRGNDIGIGTPEERLYAGKGKTRDRERLSFFVNGDGVTKARAPEATRGVDIEHAKTGESIIEKSRTLNFASGNQRTLRNITRAEVGGSWDRVWHSEGFELFDRSNVNHMTVKPLPSVVLPGHGGPVLEKKRKIVFKSGHQCNLRGVYHIDVTRKALWIIGHAEGHEIVTVANVDHVTIN